MLSAPYGVHAPCWVMLMVSQLDDFREDDKDQIWRDRSGICVLDEEFGWSACAASPHLLQDKSFRVRGSEVGRREVVCREGMDEEMRI